MILPEIKIESIDWLEKQKELNDYHRKQKGVRLDILVKDEDQRLYDVEMQIANNHDIGSRMRY
ncbi:PD-(D/E)XK nuclease family transposase [Lactobacillus amylolyticus]|uniref:PD-(D/E)XK nuclease family transposase n=1 Tax=Lactobacillus amylolyticus TaxID=83683 RepID=UPI00292A43FB|nr:PD-(D/E)XK nuclease family transposase [Lactobacillus amylolyticus]